MALHSRRQRQKKMQKNMIDDNVPADNIAKYTGLSSEQIAELASLQTV